jgi:hypothetical protein
VTLVSVLLPVHNGAPYLESAVRSILNQTHRDLELIVVDDGSTDGSAETVTAFGDSRVRLIRNARNLGLPASLNRGLSAARAGIVARQDADDLSHPRRLEAQVGFLEMNPDVGLVGTQAWLIDEQGRCLGSVEHACEHDSLVWELLFDNAFIHTSVAFRRDLVVNTQSGYDPAWPYNQDYELWVRLARITRLANLPERLVAWRSHSASMTQSMEDEAETANRRLMARHLPLVLGNLSDEQLELVALAREGLGANELRQLLPLLKNWSRAYRGSVSSRSMEDFRRTVARLYLRLALTRRGRTPARVALALWAGRHEGRALMRALFALAGERLRLALGYDPLRMFGGEAIGR